MVRSAPARMHIEREGCPSSASANPILLLDMVGGKVRGRSGLFCSQLPSRTWVPTPRPRSALIIGDRNPALPAAVSPPLASAAAFASTARLSRRWSKKMGLALLVLGLILF